MRNREVETQVSNIVETLRNFSRSEADTEAIADRLFDEIMQNDANEELADCFQEFVDMLIDVANR